MNVESQSWLPRAGASIVALIYVTSIFLPSLSIPTINPRLLDRVTSEIEARVPEGGSVTINADSFQGTRTLELRGYDCFRESLRLDSNGFPILIWCANPLVWIGAVCLAARQFTYARLAGVFACGLALIALAMPYLGRANADIYWSWYDYRIGYWCWLASAVAIVAFSYACKKGMHQPGMEIAPRLRS